MHSDYYNMVFGEKLANILYEANSQFFYERNVIEEAVNALFCEREIINNKANRYYKTRGTIYFVFR